MAASEESKIAFRRIFEELDEDATKVLSEVLKVEHKHLAKGRPYGIVTELRSSIEKVIE